jgi:ribonuclease D
MGNWEADVLTKQQLQYAATDAYISWYLYEVHDYTDRPTLSLSLIIDLNASYFT